MSLHSGGGGWHFTALDDETRDLQLGATSHLLSLGLKGCQVPGSNPGTDNKSQSDSDGGRLATL